MGGREGRHWKKAKMVVNPQEVTLLPVGFGEPSGGGLSAGEKKRLGGERAWRLEQVSQKPVLALLLLPFRPLLQRPCPMYRALGSVRLGSPHPGQTPASFQVRDPKSSPSLESQGALGQGFPTILHQLRCYRSRSRGPR